MGWYMENQDCNFKKFNKENEKNKIGNYKVNI